MILEAKDFYVEKNVVITSKVDAPYSLEFYLSVNNRNKRVWSVCRSHCIRFETKEQALRYLEVEPLPEIMLSQRTIEVMELHKSAFIGITHSKH